MAVMVAPPIVTAKTLPVPFYRQWLATILKYYQHDSCGPTVVAMMLAYLTGQDWSGRINELCAATPLARGQVGTSVADLVALLNRYGAKVQARRWNGLVDLKAEIDAGRPVILLARNGEIKGRLDQHDLGGHWVLAVGYTPDGIQINDPDYFGVKAEGGHDFVVPNAQMIRAIELSPAPGYCIYLQSATVVAPTPKIIIPDFYHGDVVDFAQLQAEACGIKVSQGISYLDPMFTLRLKLALAKQMGVLLYHFGTAADPIKQAKWFLSVAGIDPRFVYCLDLESNPFAGQGTMTIPEAEQFVSYLANATGRWPVLYAGAYLKGSLRKGQSTVLANCPLWCASYTQQLIIPSQWPAATVWQFTNGTDGMTPHALPGFTGDLSMWQDSRAAFEKMFSLAALIKVAA